MQKCEDLDNIHFFLKKLYNIYSKFVCINTKLLPNVLRQRFFSSYSLSQFNSKLRFKYMDN